MHNHIISLIGEIWAHITSLPLPLFIEVPVTSQECERSCICVLVVLILLHSTILILDFGNVLTVVFFFDDRRRTPSDGKSPHCLLQGELKMKSIKEKIILFIIEYTCINLSRINLDLYMFMN
jgi:hypothetical protein